MSAVLLGGDGMLTAWRICSELCDDVRWLVQGTVDLVFRMNHSNKFFVILQLLE